MVKCESCSSTIGHITLGSKQTGAPSAGNPHAGCDVAGAGSGFTVWLLRHSQRKRGATARLDLRSTAPVLDPTGQGSPISGGKSVNFHPTVQNRIPKIPAVRIEPRRKFKFEKPLRRPISRFSPYYSRQPAPAGILHFRWLLGFAASRSVLRLSWLFRNPGVVQNLNGGCGAKVCPVPQNPDDLLVGRHLDQLRAFSVIPARTDDGISVG